MTNLLIVLLETRVVMDIQLTLREPRLMLYLFVFMIYFFLKAG
jgi:hypothetical protein